MKNRFGYFLFPKKKIKRHRLMHRLAVLLLLTMLGIFVSMVGDCSGQKVLDEPSDTVNTTPVQVEGEGEQGNEPEPAALSEIPEVR